MKEDSIGLFGVMPKPPSLKLMARRLSVLDPNFKKLSVKGLRKQVDYSLALFSTF